MKRLLLCAAIFLGGCAGGPPAPAWQANAKYSLDAFQQAYLRGDSRVADAELDHTVPQLFESSLAIIWK